ncbi:MAG TPA: ABC transporter permease [Candidatus Margulisbacteria bacterium]|nr:MAG: ABC transporter [Candidatus Margulisbacteria bacterium GWE2_39_32]HCT85599.1 ABC transporter permease [Candidatus Margulisiibacteriota bacterium]
MKSLLLSIIKKEFFHILRDPQTLLIIIIMPIAMIFLYGYAITLEMRNIPTIVSDLSKTPESRLFVKKLVSSNFFEVELNHIDESSIDKVFRRREAKCIIVIPKDYSTGIVDSPVTYLQVIIDASDPNGAKLISNYVNNIVNQSNLEMNLGNSAPFTIQPRFLYNPDLKSANYFVPGLVAVILLLISALLTSLAIVREKEKGTMEQVLVSPINPIQIIIGKLIPYLILGFIDGLIILFAGVFWFNVPVNGSLLLLLLMMLLYIFNGLSLGLLISTIAQTQQLAMMMALMGTMLPTFLLSGFMFPIESMPILFQWLSKIIPASHFVQIIRGIMLKGVGIPELISQISFLTLLSLVLIIVSIKKFRVNLDA